MVATAWGRKLCNFGRFGSGLAEGLRVNLLGRCALACPFQIRSRQRVLGGIRGRLVVEEVGTALGW